MSSHTPLHTRIANRIRTVLLAGATCLVVIACSPKVEDKAKQFPDVLSVFHVCDMAGHIEPCGCDPEAGGIARRMSYIEQNRTEYSVIVDAGNVCAGSRDWELLEMEYILRGYLKMGYVAVNIGSNEAALDAGTLREFDDEFHLFVSANLLDETGQTVFPPYRVVEFPNDFSVGIMGVLDEIEDVSLVGEGLSIAPPGDSIAKHLPKLKSEVDFVILLAFANEEVMKGIAERFFEIDLIVGGDVDVSTAETIEVNKSAIVATTDEGKAAARVEVRFASDGSRTYTNDIQMLIDEFEDSPAIAEIVDEFKIFMVQEGIEPHRDDEEGLTSITAARSKTANSYVEPEKCRECHAGAYEKWLHSRHAAAFDNVIAKDKEYNPRCLKCHTTGHMASDGYINQRTTPHTAKVTCGACHGRGRHHIQFHSNEDVPERSAKLATVDCTRCHDEDNSPQFKFETYWEKMKHGLDEQ